ncbi:MAG: flagellar FlbD family protein [Alphaproteobacteria bacterium]|jgi:flagellar protein FlbD|nr:flagellar FlbD family protein [Alphaproteobacteria bacterium]|tara:strand:+ start:269 stop:466 length:198 start_codon:yes stop_codon:yes gene_type:complete
MIRLTRLNKNELVINAEMIEFVEAIPDTILTLTSGKKIMVFEPVDTVVERIVEYKRNCNQLVVSG